jgi:polyisoprenoid-binding protein YceI
VHSTLLFKIKHMNLAWFFGRIPGLDGVIQMDPTAPEKASVQVDIDVKTIDTGNPKRDTHLRSPDFFDVVQFPKATFQSKSVAKRGDKLAVTGELSLHGVTKTVTIDLEQTGAGKGPQGDDRVGFLGTLTIKRSEWGMKTMPDALGDEVALTISIEASRS